MNVTRIATGIVTIGMTALGKCLKKSNMMKTTVTMTSMSVSRAFAMERRISSERS